MEKTKACISPTKISNNKNGNDANIGIRNAITVINTSPAKIFPKRRKENEMIFDNSEMISRIPTKNMIGFVKLKNFFK